MRWRAVLAAALLAGTAGCGRSGGSPATKVQGAPGTAEYVAAQPGDVPNGMQRCDYSAPIDRYIESVKQVTNESSISETWKSLQAAGASEAYVAVYTDTPKTCTAWISGAPAKQGFGAARVVSSVVVRFQGPDAARAAYDADIFKQSQLKAVGSMQVASGEATGLGPSSATGADEQNVPRTHLAVWQAGPFIVFHNSRELTRTEFEAATSAQNRRAG